MSSFLCFICHNTVSSDTNEDMRDKYRDIVGMNLCPDSHLCYICHHMIDKLWTFKSVCLKRSLEYPVLFSEKGTINLHHKDIETIIICSEDTCNVTPSKIEIYVDNRDQSIQSNDYFKLEEECDNFDDDYYPETVEKAAEYDLNNQNDERVNMKFEISDDVNKEFDENHGISDDNYVTDENNGGIKEIDSEFGIKNDGGEEKSNDDSFEGDTDYENEKNECLNEIRNEGDTEVREPLENKSEPSKSKHKDFEKILLTLEEQKAELEAQRKSKKYTEAEFKCYSCALGFLFKDTYQAHMMRHEESNGAHICSLCSLRFATSALLQTHTTLHSSRYICTICGCRMRVRQCQSHSKYCNYRPSRAACCRLCHKYFTDATAVQQHIKRYHMSESHNRSYSCNVCGDNFNNQRALNTHMIKHIHKKFPCDTCPAIFSSPYTLTQHKKKHDPIQNIEKHYCETCGLSYNSRKSLLAHMRTSINHQERIYNCPICSRSCPNEKSLTSHITTVHSNNKSFCCSTCNARYNSRKSLVSHIRRHTMVEKQKKAVCHLCGSSFKNNSKLNRHLREVCEKYKLEEELASYYEQQALH